MAEDSLGLRIYRGEVAVMDTAHRHQDLELNLIFRGSITYLFGGSTLELTSGEASLFWATTPHRLIAHEEGTEFGWLTLPLTSFLRYGLPDHLVTTALQGRPITARFSGLDALLFTRWLEDGNPDSEHQTTILELELEAWLRRMALTGSKPVSSKHPSLDSKAARLARYVSEHYQEPLTLDMMASAAALSPSYAATLFKNSFGMTLNSYLTQHRVAHAQRLLVTTDRPILDLAFEAGFGSSSQFYAAFAKACARTPRAYRQAARHKA